MLKLLIFDHDMTLVDSSEGIVEALNLIASELEKPAVTREQVLRFAAVPMADFLKELWGEWRPEWAELYHLKGSPLEHKLTRAYPEVPSTLVGLRERGYLLAVASNRHFPKVSMDKSKTSHYFDAIIGVGDGYAPKPNPAMLNALMSRFAASASETLYIGDSDVDMQAARAAGVRPVGVTTGNFSRLELLDFGAWCVIEKMDELFLILEACSAACAGGPEGA